MYMPSSEENEPVYTYIALEYRREINEMYLYLYNVIMAFLKSPE